MLAHPTELSGGGLVRNVGEIEPVPIGAHLTRPILVGVLRGQQLTHVIIVAGEYFREVDSEHGAAVVDDLVAR